MTRETILIACAVVSLIGSFVAGFCFSKGFWQRRVERRGASHE